MKDFTTYIINLESEVRRKRYMEVLLSEQFISKYSFIAAVQGKSLSQTKLKDLYDEALAYKRYGRKLNRGEIGCTLSHYKCYEKIVKDDDYALILEDDISVVGDIEIISKLEPILREDSPVILFLSGDYWFYKKRKLSNNCEIASVYDAVGSYAYFINKAAAKLILMRNSRASNVADDWALYRRQGVKLLAVYPYLIDANIESFESTINQSYFGENRKNMPWKFRLKAYWNAFIKKILLRQGRFVSKIREQRTI